MAFFAGFAFTTGFRVGVTRFFAARETDFAAFRAGALAPVLAFTMCLGRAALVFSSRRLAGDLGAACRAAGRLIPFATGLLIKSL